MAAGPQAQASRREGDDCRDFGNGHNKFRLLCKLVAFIPIYFIELFCPVLGILFLPLNEEKMEYFT